MKQTASNGLDFEISLPTIRLFSHRCLKVGGKKAQRESRAPYLLYSLNVTTNVMRLAYARVNLRKPKSSSPICLVTRAPQ